MNWKVVLGVLLLSFLLGMGPSFADYYEKQFGVLIGLAISILGLIVNLVYLVNSKISHRIEEDKLLAAVRTNTPKNERVESLVKILDGIEMENLAIRQNIERNLQSTIDYANSAVASKTITDSSTNTLMDLYRNFDGNIFILSKNEVCDAFWCSIAGNQILEINLELAAKKTFKGLGKPKCKIERIFIQNGEPSPTTKTVIDKQVKSKIKCFKVEESKVGGIKFCDAVIFENYAVCETQININKEPHQYDIHFQESKLSEFMLLYEKVKNKASAIN